MELVNPARPELLQRQIRLAKNEYSESRLATLLIMGWTLILLGQDGLAAIGFINGHPMPFADLALGLFFFGIASFATLKLVGQFLRHRDRQAIEQARRQGDIIEIPDWAQGLWQDAVAQVTSELGVSTDDESFLPIGAVAFRTLADLRVDFDHYAASQAAALRATTDQARETYESDCDLIKAAVTQHVSLVVEILAQRALAGQSDRATLDHELTRALVERPRQLPPLD